MEARRIKGKKNLEEEEKKKSYEEEELIFETTENLEVYRTFDEMGLREDLLKGKLKKYR